MEQSDKDIPLIEHVLRMAAFGSSVYTATQAYRGALDPLAKRFFGQDVNLSTSIKRWLHREQAFAGFIHEVTKFAVNFDAEKMVEQQALKSQREMLIDRLKARVEQTDALFVEANVYSGNIMEQVAKLKDPDLFKSAQVALENYRNLRNNYMGLTAKQIAGMDPAALEYLQSTPKTTIKQLEEILPRLSTAEIDEMIERLNVVKSRALHMKDILSRMEGRITRINRSSDRIVPPEKFQHMSINQLMGKYYEPHRLASINKAHGVLTDGGREIRAASNLSFVIRHTNPNPIEKWRTRIPTSPTREMTGKMSTAPATPGFLFDRDKMAKFRPENLAAYNKWMQDMGDWRADLISHSSPEWAQFANDLKGLNSISSSFTLATDSISDVAGLSPRGLGVSAQQEFRKLITRLGELKEYGDIVVEMMPDKSAFQILLKGRESTIPDLRIGPIPVVFMEHGVPYFRHGGKTHVNRGVYQHLVSNDYIMALSRNLSTINRLTPGERQAYFDRLGANIINERAGLKTGYYTDRTLAYEVTNKVPQSMEKQINRLRKRYEKLLRRRQLTETDRTRIEYDIRRMRGGLMPIGRSVNLEDPAFSMMGFSPSRAVSGAATVLDPSGQRVLSTVLPTNVDTMREPWAPYWKGFTRGQTSSVQIRDVFNSRHRVNISRGYDWRFRQIIPLTSIGKDQPILDPRAHRTFRTQTQGIFVEGLDEQLDRLFFVNGKLNMGIFRENSPYMLKKPIDVNIGDIIGWVDTGKKESIEIPSEQEYVRDVQIVGFEPGKQNGVQGHYVKIQGTGEIGVGTKLIYRTGAGRISMEGLKPNDRGFIGVEQMFPHIRDIGVDLFTPFGDKFDNQGARFMLFFDFVGQFVGSDPRRQALYEDALRKTFSKDSKQLASLMMRHKGYLRFYNPSDSEWSKISPDYKTSDLVRFMRNLDESLGNTFRVKNVLGFGDFAPADSKLRHLGGQMDDSALHGLLNFYTTGNAWTELQPGLSNRRIAVQARLIQRALKGKKYVRAAQLIFGNTAIKTTEDILGQAYPMAWAPIGAQGKRVLAWISDRMVTQGVHATDAGNGFSKDAFSWGPQMINDVARASGNETLRKVLLDSLASSQDMRTSMLHFMPEQFGNVKQLKKMGVKVLDWEEFVRLVPNAIVDPKAPTVGGLLGNENYLYNNKLMTREQLIHTHGEWALSKAQHVGGDTPLAEIAPKTIEALRALGTFAVKLPQQLRTSMYSNKRMEAIVLPMMSNEFYPVADAQQPGKTRHIVSGTYLKGAKLLDVIRSFKGGDFDAYNKAVGEYLQADEWISPKRWFRTEGLMGGRAPIVKLGRRPFQNTFLPIGSTTKDATKNILMHYFGISNGEMPTGSLMEVMRGAPGLAVNEGEFATWMSQRIMNRFLEGYSDDDLKQLASGWVDYNKTSLHPKMSMLQHMAQNAEDAKERKFAKTSLQVLDRLASGKRLTAKRMEVMGKRVRAMMSDAIMPYTYGHGVKPPVTRDVKGVGGWGWIDNPRAAIHGMTDQQTRHSIMVEHSMALVGGQGWDYDGDIAAILMTKFDKLLGVISGDRNRRLFPEGWTATSSDLTGKALMWDQKTGQYSHAIVPPSFTDTSVAQRQAATERELTVKLTAGPATFKAQGMMSEFERMFGGHTDYMNMLSHMSGVYDTLVEGVLKGKRQLAPGAKDIADLFRLAMDDPKKNWRAFEQGVLGEAAAGSKSHQLLLEAIPGTKSVYGRDVSGLDIFKSSLLEGTSWSQYFEQVGVISKSKFHSKAMRQFLTHREPMLLRTLMETGFGEGPEHRVMKSLIQNMKKSVGDQNWKRMGNGLAWAAGIFGAYALASSIFDHTAVGRMPGLHTDVWAGTWSRNEGEEDLLSPTVNPFAKDRTYVIMDNPSEARAISKLTRREVKDLTLINQQLGIRPPSTSSVITQPRETRISNDELLRRYGGI